MTRLITDGAEDNELQRISASSCVSTQSSVKRNGNFAYYLYSGGNYAGYLAYPPFAPITEYFSRFAIQFPSNRAAAFLRPLNGGAQSHVLCSKTFGYKIATLDFYDGGTLRATTPPFSMNLNKMHVIETHGKIAAAPNGIFQVKFDGILILDFHGATNSQPSIDQLSFGPGSNAWIDFYLDDIAFNDTNGPVDNSWIGDGGVLPAKVPIGPGKYADWVASAGLPYACIDEIPNNNSDFISADAVGKKSVFALSNLAGLPAGASITRVWAEWTARKNTTDLASIASLVCSGATEVEGTPQELTMAPVRFFSPEYLVDPADSAPWTTAKVDALQIGPIAR